MRKRFLSLLLAGLLTLTVGCGQQSAPVEESPDAPEVQEPTEPVDPRTLEWSIPEEYLDLLIVDTELEDADEHWVSLVTVHEKASVEAAEAEWGDGAGTGFLFGLCALDQIAFEQFLQYDMAGTFVFARGGGWYYAKTFATDVQFYRQDGEIDTESEDWATWEELNTLGETVCQDFVTRNGLEPYTALDIQTAPFTWEGEHAYAQYYEYYSVDGSRDEFYTLLLSQPARQGEGGIWCVDRMYDLLGYQYLNFGPEDVTAAEYYESLQAECDAGQHPELLTPLGAAKAYVTDTTWLSGEGTDENVVLVDRLDTEYIEVNQKISQLLAALIWQPEEATEQEILDAIGSFRSDTWGVMSRRNYGSDWWGPLQEALERVAVGDGQAERDAAMMHFFTTAYGPYAQFIGQQLSAQRDADPDAFLTALKDFDPNYQTAILAAVE